LSSLAERIKFSLVGSTKQKREADKFGGIRTLAYTFEPVTGRETLRWWAKAIGQLSC
jgi:hypothetical protein